MTSASKDPGLSRPEVQPKAQPEPKPNQANTGTVQGEGDYEAAQTYGESVRSFVQSGKVDEAAKAAKPSTSQQQQELLEAEREGSSHSKGEDPASPNAPSRTLTDKP